MSSKASRDMWERLMTIAQSQEETERRKFFWAPQGLQAPLSEKNARLLTQAEQVLGWTREVAPKSNIWTRCLEAEAWASSAIEDECRPEMLERHARALEKCLGEKPSRRGLLRMHRTIADGLAHAQPGRYRTVNVRVGNHRGAEFREVARLMTGLFRYIRDSRDPPPVKAAWAHVQFETIHPFADGNGRTGRAIISQILEFPLPLSEWILQRKWEYYRALGKGDWESYLEWILTGMKEQSELYGRGGQD